MKPVTVRLSCALINTSAPSNSLSCRDLQPPAQSASTATVNTSISRGAILPMAA
jgi:hypothetical protein